MDFTRLSVFKAKKNTTYNNREFLESLPTLVLVSTNNIFGVGSGESTHQLKKTNGFVFVFHQLMANGSGYIDVTGVPGAKVNEEFDHYLLYVSVLWNTNDLKSTVFLRTHYVILHSRTALELIVELINALILFYLDYYLFIYQVTDTQSRKNMASVHIKNIIIVLHYYLHKNLFMY